MIIKICENGSVNFFVNGSCYSICDKMKASKIIRYSPYFATLKIAVFCYTLYWLIISICYQVIDPLIACICIHFVFWAIYRCNERNRYSSELLSGWMHCCASRCSCLIGLLMRMLMLMWRMLYTVCVLMSLGKLNCSAFPVNFVCLRREQVVVVRPLSAFNAYFACHDISLLSGRIITKHSSGESHAHCWQIAELSHRDHAAGCVP